MLKGELWCKKSSLAEQGALAGAQRKKKLGLSSLEDEVGRSGELTELSCGHSGRNFEGLKAN